MFGVSRYVLPYWRLRIGTEKMEIWNSPSEAFCWSRVHPWWHSMLQYWKPRMEHAQRGTGDFGRRSWLRFLVPWVAIFCHFLFMVHFTRSYWEEDVVSRFCHLADYVSCMYHLSQRCHPTPARIWRWPSLPLATRAMKVPTTSHAKQFCVCVLQVFMSRNFTSLCHGKKTIQARRRTWTWNWGPRWKSVISTCLI